MLLIAMATAAWAQPMSCELPPGFDPSSQEIGGSIVSLGLADDTLSGDVNVTGILNVDATFSLINAVVQVKQGPIIVERFDTLVLRNTLITVAVSGSPFTDVWEGIIIEPGGVLLMDSSTICYAKQAVLSEGSYTEAGEFQISQSRFSKNYLGLKAENYSAGPHPGSIHATTFRGGALPFVGPGGATFGSVGVWIDSVSDNNTPWTRGLVLGDTSQAPNIFDSLDYGVYAINSSLYAQNNRFNNIQNINGFGAGYGIQSWTPTGSGLADVVDLILGPLGVAPSGENTFTDCRIGVIAEAMDRVKINGNTFRREDDYFRTGILVRQTSGEINIGNNTIDTFRQQGIWLDDNDNNDAVAVYDNTITSYETPTSLDNTAILIEQPTTSPSLSVAVNGNSITGPQRGIVLLNVESAFTPIRDNTIRVNWVNTGDPVAGIALFGVDSALVEGNTIRSNCTTVPCTNQDIFGIYTENSIRVVLRENRLDTVAYGALIVETSTAGNANCNVFTDCGVGFGFQNLGTGAIYGPVYGIWGAPDTTTVSDNAWIPASTSLRSICFGPTGTRGSDIYWSYRAPSSSVPPDPSMVILPGPPLNTTGGGSLITNALEPDSVFAVEPWCNDTAFMLRTSESGDEGLLNGRLEAALERALYSPQDASFDYLYYYVDAFEHTYASINGLKEAWGCAALDAWSENWSWTEASTPTALSILDEHHRYTGYLMDVFEIMQLQPQRSANPGAQDSIAIPWTSWPSRLSVGDLASLQFRAAQYGRTGGPAVYAARALLNQQPMLTAIALPEVEEKASDVIEPALTNVWPNPSSTEVNALVPVGVTDCAVLNHNGRLIHSQSVREVEKVLISTKAWPSGIYFIRWMDGSIDRLSQSFIVHHP